MTTAQLLTWSTARYSINSEGDANGKCPKKIEGQANHCWDFLATRFRNFQEPSIIAGKACAMPSVLVNDLNKIYLQLDFEFASRECTVFDQYCNDENRPTTAALIHEIDTLIDTLYPQFPKIGMERVPETEAYFYLTLIAEENDKQILVKAAIAAANAIKNNKILSNSHEWIG